MRILIAASELHPYSKSGGLADMVAALAKALVRRGNEVEVVTPFHRTARRQFPDLPSEPVQIPLGGRTVSAAVCRAQTPQGLRVQFVHQPDFFDRPGLYQEEGRDYADNAERFIFFAKVVAHLVRHGRFHPELVHLHDWQTGLVPLLMLHQRIAEGWREPPATCLTIHNLSYQGVFPAWAYGLTGLPDAYFNIQGPEFYGQMNCLKAGICYADDLTTVSPRYAKEITTPELGCGLDTVLRSRAEHLCGILNGVDEEEWTTRDNPYLPASYDAKDLSGKAVVKAALQKEIGLPVRAEAPLFANITRLAYQKGVDLLLGSLEEMLAADMQFVELGEGDPSLKEALVDLARRYPDKVAIHFGFNQGLSHRVEAGSDFFLMPSRFEPCGLNQLYSLRYGTVPVVRATGGLVDTVVDATEDPARADGIKFGPASVLALSRAIRKALVLYGDPAALRHYRRNGMRVDHGWEKAAASYEAHYARVARRYGAGRPVGGVARTKR